MNATKTATATLFDEAQKLQLFQMSKATANVRDHTDWRELTPKQQATQLVRDGLLTQYQADVLLEGKGSGLVAGPYRLLSSTPSHSGQVGLAAHTVTGKKVRLWSGSTDDPTIAVGFATLAQVCDHLMANPHPNLANVLSFEQSAGKFRLVVDCPEGQSLEAILESKGSLSIEQAVVYALMIAGGLAALHDQKIVHGGLQPANVILNYKEQLQIDQAFEQSIWSQNQAKPQTLTIANLQANTAIDFVAPEQAWGDPTTSQSDIYRFGLLLYTMLTGQRAFTGPIMQRLADRQARAVPLLAGRVANFPKELDAVLQKLTAPQANQRYATIREVIHALLPFAPRSHALADAPLGLDRSARKPLAEVSPPLGASNAKTLPIWLMIGATLFALLVIIALVVF